MTEEKLREKIALRLWDFSTLDSEDKLVEETKYVDQILTLIREAGWRSPEEVGTISQWFEKGRKSVLRTNPSGCSCLFDEQDNIVSVCGAHQDWYEEKLKQPQ